MRAIALALLLIVSPSLFAGEDEVLMLTEAFARIQSPCKFVNPFECPLDPKDAKRIDDMFLLLVELYKENVLKETNHIVLGESQ